MNQPRTTSALGLLAIAFFGIHACCQYRAGTASNLLWICHVADLCVGVGLVMRWRSLVAAGVLMLSIGIPMWIISLWDGGDFYPTSALTHLGGITIGLIGLTQLGLPRRSWLTGVGVVAVLLILSRGVTPVELNVNIAFVSYFKLPKYLSADEIYVLLLLGFWGSSMWIVEKSLLLIPRFGRLAGERA